MNKDINKLLKDNLLFKDPSKLRKIVYYNLEIIIKEIYKINKTYIEENTNNILNIYPETEVFNTWFVSFLIDNKYNPDILLSYLSNNPHIKVSNYYLSLLILSGKYIKDSSVSIYLPYLTKDNPKLLATKQSFLKEKIDTRVIDKVINENIDLLATEMIISINSVAKDSSNSVKNLYLKELPFIKQLIKELTKSTQINLSDIIPLTKGANNVPYKIGDKVLKIGSSRRTFNINDNKRFLKPLYRKDIKLDDKNILYLEITQYVDTNNITNEDVYQIYQELREQNIYWLDPKPENLGRLTKENRIYYPGITSVDILSTGYKTKDDTILPPGELIILDNDYIFTEEELIKLNLLKVIKNNKYERRYQENKKNKVIK